MTALEDIKGGSKFRVTYNLPGQKSLKSQVAKMSRAPGEYRNLNAQDREKIADVIKPYESSIRKYGGLSARQIIDIRHDLYQQMQAQGGSLSYEDFTDAMKIVNQLSKSTQQRLLKKAPDEPKMRLRRADVSVAPSGGSTSIARQMREQNEVGADRSSTPKPPIMPTIV